MYHPNYKPKTLLEIALQQVRAEADASTRAQHMLENALAFVQAQSHVACGRGYGIYMEPKVHWEPPKRRY